MSAVEPIRVIQRCMPAETHYLSSTGVTFALRESPVLAGRVSLSIVSNGPAFLSAGMSDLSSTDLRRIAEACIAVADAMEDQP